MRRVSINEPTPVPGSSARPRFAPSVLRSALFAIGFSGSFASAQPAGTPFIARTLLDHTLAAHPVLVHRLDGSMITYTDARGLLRREPTSEFLAILPGEGPTGWRRDGNVDTLTLVDGQRFTGSMLPAPDGDEPPVMWDASFADLEFPLERVATLIRAGATPANPDATGDDVIGLANGDTVTGFILSLGELVEIETASGDVGEFPLARVSWARLANPAISPQGAMLWLSDGTVACVEPMAQSTPESLEARLLGPGEREASLSEGQSPRISVPLAAVRALAFEPARLVGLGTLPVAQTQSDRPWTPELVLSDASDEPLGAPDITLPAPMLAAWTIPPSARRVAFEATLPERCRLWGDAEVVVTLQQDAGRAELARTRLHAGEPVAGFNIPLHAPTDARRERRLIIELVAGASGPAQDAVVLERALLLLESR